MKIDLFNHKKIKHLENEIETLWSTQSGQDKRLFELEKKESKCEHTQEITEIGMILKELLDYLKLYPKEVFEDDMSYDIPRRPQKRRLKIFSKILNNKKVPLEDEE